MFLSDDLELLGSTGWYSNGKEVDINLRDDPSYPLPNLKITKDLFQDYQK